jgi:MFS transporter, DHA1 family, inner membrane transport protein
VLAGIAHPRLQTLVVLSSVYFAMGVAMDVLVALLPSIAATFAVSISVAAWVVTVRAGGALFSPVLGVQSDVLGRKRILLLSLIVLALANLGSAAVQGFSCSLC